jgi:hypothetical protein
MDLEKSGKIIYINYTKNVFNYIQIFDFNKDLFYLVIIKLLKI